MAVVKQKRILITGGAGFLGSHLCERLLSDGHKVICVDNFYTGARQNIAPLLSNPNFELITHDISNPMTEKVDEIYNLACPASPVHYQRDPVYTMKTSVYGAINMLDLARGLNIKILQASTSEVYGDPMIHPQAESYWGHVNCTGVRSCYDEGKRCAEALFFDFHRLFQLSIKVVRIFNTYGPKMLLSDGRVVSSFIVQALRGEPITIYGNGNQTRSLCYVDDLIEAIVRMMHTDRDFLGPVNIGSPNEISILELAKVIVELTESKSKFKFRPLPEDDPKQRRPDISIAKKKLEWEPNVELKDGLRKTIEFFKGQIR